MPEMPSAKSSVRGQAKKKKAKKKKGGSADAMEQWIAQCGGAEGALKAAVKAGNGEKLREVLRRGYGPAPSHYLPGPRASRQPSNLTMIGRLLICSCVLRRATDVRAGQERRLQPQDAPPTSSLGGIRSAPHN